MPLAGHDSQHAVQSQLTSISTPMPLAGHDSLLRCELGAVLQFLLPCPSRGMTQYIQLSVHFVLISTPMPLAGHDYHLDKNNLL